MARHLSSFSMAALALCVSGALLVPGAAMAASMDIGATDIGSSVLMEQRDQRLEKPRPSQVTRACSLSSDVRCDNAEGVSRGLFDSDFNYDSKIGAQGIPAGAAGGFLFEEN